MILDQISQYWTLAPNWKYGVGLSHIWRTGIVKGVTAPEQRSSYFGNYRLKETFQVDAFSFAESAWLSKVLFHYSESVWGIPVWPDWTLLSASVVSGASSLPVIVTAYRHFLAGWPCILISPADFQVYDAVEIEEVSSNLITLAGTVSHNWPAGSMVYPVFPASISNDNLISDLTSVISGARIEANQSLFASL